MSTHPAAEVPDRLFADDETEARWRARFTAARVSLPTWGRDVPDRNVYLSNASGVWAIRIRRGAEPRLHTGSMEGLLDGRPGT